jgi:poly(beta-D-mannuronate) lyase
VAVILVVLGMFQVNQKDSTDLTKTASSMISSANDKTSAQYPASKLDLTNWKITLPIDKDKNNAADEVKQPQLHTLSYPPYFMLAPDGVAFRAYADGATTDNSGYPRSELREMTDDGQKKASWSNTSGSHSMTIEEAITHLPDVKREVVAGQIHDAEDDIVMIRLEGTHLFVEANGKNIGDLNPNYNLGEKFVVKITAENDKINIFYNNVLKVTYNKSGTGYYFKAGCYTQTNIGKGDPTSSYGEVVIYDLEVSHT